MSSWLVTVSATGDGIDIYDVQPHLRQAGKELIRKHCVGGARVSERGRVELRLHEHHVVDFGKPVCRAWVSYIFKCIVTANNTKIILLNPI